MDRRRFLLTSLAGAVAAPLGAGAQQGTVPRVGWLSLLSGTDAQGSVDIFRQTLRDLGHVEGQSVAMEYRWAGGNTERLFDLATELVRLKVAVIVAQGGVPAAQAAQRATRRFLSSLQVLLIPWRPGSSPASHDRGETSPDQPLAPSN
jgi:hypothetical protein